MTKNRDEKDFATGWRSWCRWGSRPVDGPPAKLAGWDAAAWENDHGGGVRPRSTDAAEAAREWIANR